MEKTDFNLHENKWIQNIDQVFGVMIYEWLDDIVNGNKAIIPKNITEAKKEILRISKEWMVVPPYGKRSEYEMYWSELQLPWILIRKDVIEQYVDDLFKNKDEAIDLGLYAGWIEW